MLRLTLFLFIFGIIHRTNGQTCTWTWTQPSDGTTTITKSPGAPATVAATVNDVLNNEDTITWKNGAVTELSVEEYVDATDSFTSVTNARGFVTNRTPNAATGQNEYSLTFPSGGVTVDDDGATITVTSQGCASGGTITPAITLIVRNCDLSYYGGDANATDAADCGYDCVREFTCTSTTASSPTFSSTCGENAEWSVAAAPCSDARQGLLHLGLATLCIILAASRLI